LGENIKGEFVILIPREQKEEKDKNWEELTLEQHYAYYEKQGIEKKEIIKQIAKDRKTNKNEIYQYFIK